MMLPVCIVLHDLRSCHSTIHGRALLGWGTPADSHAVHSRISCCNSFLHSSFSLMLYGVLPAYWAMGIHWKRLPPPGVLLHGRRPGKQSPLPPCYSLTLVHTSR